MAREEQERFRRKHLIKEAERIAEDVLHTNKMETAWLTYCRTHDIENPYRSQMLYWNEATIEQKATLHWTEPIYSDPFCFVNLHTKEEKLEYDRRRIMFFFNYILESQGAQDAYFFISRPDIAALAHECGFIAEAKPWCCYNKGQCNMFCPNFHAKGCTLYDYESDL